ncbi:MAG: ABC transporter permease [Saprospiraceae bacterium]
MIKNYFKIAWRNLLRNKLYSLLNIGGLALGLATCVVILLFVKNELSYDRFNEKADRMVRVVFRADIDGGKINEANVMPPTAQTLLNDYPEVEEATRLRSYGKPKVNIGENTFKEGKFAFVDANFFQVFTLPLIKGDPQTALIEPNTIIISEKMADRFFGEEEPIGQVLNFQEWNQSYKVTGVMEEVPQNAHFHFDLFGSMAGLEEARKPSWMTSEFHTYLVLRKGFDYKELEAKLPEVIEKYMGPQLTQAMGITLEQFRNKGNKIGLFLQPLTEIHLYSDVNLGLEPGGDVRYVYIFSAVAFFMLIIACINFINLTTASATKRALEVGVRKVIGAPKRQLMGQFLTESVLLTFLALFAALALVQATLPTFNRLADKNLSFDLLADPILPIGLLVLGLVVGLVAGLYPAFFLAGFKPIAVLKGKFSTDKSSAGLRSGLVVFQFFVSTVMIVGTIVIYQQLAYIQHKKLGYDKDQLLVLPDTWMLGQQEEVFRQQILNDPRVLNATVSAYRPAGYSANNNSMAYPDGKESDLMRTLEYRVDEQYIPTFGMKMAAGRNFSTDFSTDSTAIIINQSAVTAFGWEDALGHTITRLKNNDGTKIVYQVIGVVEDFHFKSLHEPITPLLMVLGKSSGLTIKAKTADMNSLIASLQEQWTTLKPDEPFSYGFIDELLRETYLSEQKSGQILKIFSLLTILVSCLGLFGLATFTADQRKKEIGVRKVLGATEQQITWLLSRDFLKLVFIACLLAVPVAYWGMTKWLQDFAYRIEMEWWVFVLAGFSTGLIALLTVSYHAIRSALLNPVEALKTE